MSIRIRTAIFLALLFFVASGCGKGDQSAANAAAPDPGMVQVSQYGGSEYCSIACAADGTLHAVYTDRSEATKPAYLFYRSSKDNGATWGPSKNLSDDESGISAAYCRVLVDGKGRVYAIWKYLTSNDLDGAGGAAGGNLAYRCLEGDKWSKIIRFNDKKAQAISWFAANGPDGSVHVIWSQGNPDIDWTAMGGANSMSGNLIQQSILDGATLGAPKGLIVPKPMPTAEQLAVLHTNHDYSQDAPEQNGLWNLRGYIDAAANPHFVAEHYPIKSGYNSTGELFMRWDGTKLAKIFEMERFAGHENYCYNPWTLLVDSKGKEHLLRKPEKSEKECVRDYPIENGELGDPEDVIAPEKPPGGISNWQAGTLSDGRLIVTASLSQKGGWDPDDVELYVSIFDNGKWSPQVATTNNVARQAFSSKAGVALSTTYKPEFAEAVRLKDGSVGLLIVNAAWGVVGVTNAGVTGSGRVVTGISTASTKAPWVFFHKL